MKRTAAPQIQLTLVPDKAIYQQIVAYFISEIRRGRLLPGAVVPGTRQLATQLQVNRNTVVLAYEELIAHGWLTTQYKSGTCVSEALPETVKEKNITSTGTRHLPEHLFQSFDFPKPNDQQQKKQQLVFDDGLPDVRLAPLPALAREYRRIFQQKSRWQLMGYASERGDEKLLGAIHQLLSAERGLAIGPAEICITRGSQMALYIAAKTLIRPGDVAAVEHPGYMPAWHTFELAGAKLQPIPVDAAGIDINRLENLCKKTKLKVVYVTPHHQYPTTATMKIDRRLALLALSDRYGFVIIEDDYDHEYHFGSRSMLPLSGMSHQGQVIYIGTLSKLVAPAVRIGFLSGPANFIAAAAACRSVIDRQGDPVMEQAVANLLLSGEIKKHTRRALQVYRRRRQLACDTVSAALENFTPPEGGLALWLPLPAATQPDALVHTLQLQGVSIVHPSRYFTRTHKGPVGLRLGYGALEERLLLQGLKKVIKAAGLK